MTEALQLALGIVMLLVTLLNISVIVAFRSGKFAGGQAGSIGELARSLEMARHSVSDVTGAVAALSARMDRDFVRRDVLQVIEEKTESEHQAIWHELRTLRQEHGRRG